MFVSSWDEELNLKQVEFFSICKNNHLHISSYVSRSFIVLIPTQVQFYASVEVINLPGT